jgi:hypothetical protein
MPVQGNRIWGLRLLKGGTASWKSGAINSDRGCRNGEEPASVRSFARSKGSSASNHLPDFSYAIALDARDRFAAWKIKPRIVVRLTFGFCK